MTTVQGRRNKARTISPTSFVDITEVEVLDIVPVGDETAVIFDGELDAAQVAAVLNRMDSTGPADEVARADLKADRDALDVDDPLRRVYDYLLDK